MNGKRIEDQAHSAEVESLGPEAAHEFQMLLAKVRLGDAMAIDMLVDRYQRAILRAVRARLGRPMRTLLDSMDIVQSVHRSLLIGLRQDKFEFQSPDQLIALAALMVQRKVARHWSRIKRGYAQVQSISTSSKNTGNQGNSVAADRASIDQVAASDPSPSMVLAGEELLSACLAKLNEFDQQLVHLKLAGQSTAEAAQHLGRDSAFVRMRWSRLRRTLRESGCLS